MNLVHNAKQRGQELVTADLATSFQQAVVDVLVGKTLKALAQYPVKQFILAGGVAANSGLRQRLSEELASRYPELEVLIPPLSLCGDNAAMIGAAAYPLYLQKRFSPLTLNAKPGLFL